MWMVLHHSIQTQIDSKQATITAGTNLSFDGNTLNTSAKPAQYNWISRCCSK